ncbi:discoidin domain-containing protein [Celerinatantimonas sp. MCCC 1A17872]|uniref:discoidin domain-containing protein n=1 Tax=Celerinatantimonas sp. MCCC 1A17872 TaxID=3177514 RepID=UPI0038C103C9
MKKNILLVSLLASLAFSVSAASISNITASGANPEKGHLIEHIADGKPGTRWAIPNKGWVEFELASNTELKNFLIIPFKGDQRRLKFDVEYSLDNQTWKPLTSAAKQTNLKAKNGEIFTFSPVKAKYVKFNVYGTDVNHWSAINEIQFNSAKKVEHVAL